MNVYLAQLVFGDMDGINLGVYSDYELALATLHNYHIRREAGNGHDDITWYHFEPMVWEGRARNVVGYYRIQRFIVQAELDQ